MAKNQLEIQLTDSDSKPIKEATILVTPEAIGQKVSADYDARRRIYFVEKLRPGFFKVELSHPDFKPEVRRVQVHPRPTRVRFLLIRRDVGEGAYVFQGGERVEIKSAQDSIGIIFSLAKIEKEGALQDLIELFNKVGSKPDWLPASADVSTVTDIVIPWTTTVSVPTNPVVNPLEVLRESEYVEAAGSIFSKSGETMTVFTHRLIVEFRPEANRNEINRILEHEGLRIVEVMSYAPSLFLVSADTSIDVGDINKKVLALLDSPLVSTAELSLAQGPGNDSTSPSDFLWLGCWDRRLVRAELAWEELRKIHHSFKFGRPELMIAVVDRGIKSIRGDAEHPDLAGEVSNKTKKIPTFFDFARMVDNNDEPAPGDGQKSSPHGVSCAGVAAASADNPSQVNGTGLGLAGAAPNVRLMGIIFASEMPVIAQMFNWVAGLPTKSARPRFPGPPPEGADVMTCSISFGIGLPIPVSIERMLDNITRRGRDAKGCMAVFSAGNESRDIFLGRPFGSYEKAFSCAASTLDALGNEVRAEYSGWGDVAWCVPSSTNSDNTEGIFHDPPESYGIFTTTFLGAGDMPSIPLFRTALSKPAVPEEKSIFVRDIGKLKEGDNLVIGLPGAGDTEKCRITALPNPSNGEILIDGLENEHSENTPVFFGPLDCMSKFGETSAAAPLSAGICALVLSANPKLTWVEAREVLRSTACKINPASEDCIARWLDEDDLPITQTGKPAVRSLGYGYGRLNAYAAVKEARAYRFTRDLMIRKNLKDKGTKPSAPSVDSPDIWVRNTDPAIDPGALPRSFNVTGPHQDPIGSEDQWIYARVKNRGSEASLDAWVRFYLALSEVEEFPFPESWEASNGTGNLTSTDWELGTYFIGEVALPSIKGGENLIINMPWPQKMLPISAVSTQQPWGFYLLVEITPHDGPLKGNQIHNNNNLAAKRISIVNRNE